MRSSAALALVWLVWAAASARAQQPDAAGATAPPPQAGTLTTSTSLVVVPALVRDASGHVVYNLNAEDFILTDDGVPQPLHLEEDTGGEPIALVVVIEAGAATRAAGWRPHARGPAPDRFHGVPAMVEAMVAGVKHQVAVVGFDSQPELEQPFTSDFDEAAEVIEQLDQGNAGDHGAGILDALVLAVDLLRQTPTGYRRAILLLSETNDRGSKTALPAALQAITETNTAIYSVAFSTPFHQASEYGNKTLPTKAESLGGVEEEKKAHAAGQPAPDNPAEEVAGRILQGVMFGFTLENGSPMPAGGCMAADPRPHPDPEGAPVPLHDRLGQAYDCLAVLLPPFALAKMALVAAADSARQNVPRSVARLTGGEYFEFNTAKTLEDDLATLSNHIPNRYILSFQPKSPHAGLHVLTLALRQSPQLQVTARTSYWAEGVETPPPAPR